MKRFKNILCVVGDVEIAGAAVSQAARLANEHQAELTLMSILYGAGRSKELPLTDAERVSMTAASLELKRTELLILANQSNQNSKAKVVVVFGISFLEIIKQVISGGHDLVVKCAEPASWLDRMFGSDDMHLLRKCPCAVLMLKQERASNFKTIMATVDVSDSTDEIDKFEVQKRLNHRVLECGSSLALIEFSDFHIVSIWEAYAETFLRNGAFMHLSQDEVDQYVDSIHATYVDRLEGHIDDMNSDLGDSVARHLHSKCHLIKGKPLKEIPMLAEQLNVDLIVMGTVGRVGVPGFIIGNTAESILSQVKCSVLALKPEGFRTPVQSE